MRPRALPALAALALACSAPSRSTPVSDPVTLVLEDVDGGQVVFPSFRGKIVVVHFFATWSLAAMADVEELRKLRAASPGTEIVGIGLDPDGATLLSPWRAAVEADWWIALPDASVTAGETPFGKILAVPATFVLDEEGQIRWSKGTQLAPGEIAKVVGSLEHDGRGP